jgi:tetratricopeptide (TPR) repeat protein
MKRFLFLLFVLTLSGCAVMTPLQRSKLIAAFHLIEIKNYTEAKKVIDEMTEDEKSSKWARTWYARGLLAQNAYKEGTEKNDRRFSELYPDQLYLAFGSYEKARSLDRGGKFERTLAPKYVLLANDFQKIGEAHFRGSRYEEALRAFEQAIKVTQNPILDMKPDNNLIYNAAMAAFENKDMDKSVRYLEKLNEQNFSSNVLHLLFNAFMEKGDTLSAEKALIEGISKYENNETIILLLTDHYYRTGNQQKAMQVIENAASTNPARQSLHYTRGLLFQKNEQYEKAIEAYMEAIKLAPDDLLTLINIATCYFNIGVEIEEKARTAANNRIAQENKLKSEAAYASAITWLDKAYEKDTDNLAIIIRMYQLYRDLSVSDKARNIQSRLN